MVLLFCFVPVMRQSRQNVSTLPTQEKANNIMRKLCFALGCEIKANLTSNLWFFLVNVKIPNNDNKCYHLRSISIKMYSVNSLIWNSAEMKKNKKNYGKLVSNRVFSFSCMINGLSSFSFSVTFFLK